MVLYQIGYDGNIVIESFLMPGGELDDIKAFRDLSVRLDLNIEAMVRLWTDEVVAHVVYRAKIEVYLVYGLYLK